jgi:hypothetical protein
MKTERQHAIDRANEKATLVNGAIDRGNFIAAENYNSDRIEIIRRYNLGPDNKTIVHAFLTSLANGTYGRVEMLPQEA